MPTTCEIIVLSSFYLFWKVFFNSDVGWNVPILYNPNPKEVWRKPFDYISHIMALIEWQLLSWRGGVVNDLETGWSNSRRSAVNSGGVSQHEMKENVFFKAHRNIPSWGNVRKHFWNIARTGENNKFYVCVRLGSFSPPNCFERAAQNAAQNVKLRRLSCGIHFTSREKFLPNGNNARSRELLFISPRKFSRWNIYRGFTPMFL